MVERECIHSLSLSVSVSPPHTHNHNHTNSVRPLWSIGTYESYFKFILSSSSFFDALYFATYYHIVMQNICCISSILSWLSTSVLYLNGLTCDLLDLSYDLGWLDPTLTKMTLTCWDSKVKTWDLLRLRTHVWLAPISDCIHRTSGLWNNLLNALTCL